MLTKDNEDKTMLDEDKTKDKEEKEAKKKQDDEDLDIMTTCAIIACMF